MYDVTIIGAGVCGCAVARELSRYDLKICVLEKDDDVCSGTSKANSAIIHAGFDAKESSLMAKLNVLGNSMFDELAKELDFPFKRNGSLVVCFSEDEKQKLEELLERGIKNGVPDLRIIDREELLKLEPNISDEAYAALYAPTGGIVCPFNFTIALAENAAENGVEFKLETTVEKIYKAEGFYKIETDKGLFETKYIVNAAGVYADKFHNMVSENKIEIIPRRGEYCLLDKAAGKHVERTVFSVPGKYGKGVLVTPTVHGNLLIGPTAVDTDDKENTATTYEGLNEVIEKSSRSVKNIPMKQVITSFSGLRAHTLKNEFIIEEVSDAKGFIDVAGIESPGLSSAPAIGVMAADIVVNLSKAVKKKNFVSERKGILNPSELPLEERNRLISEHPEYGNIVCRCEMVTEGEILDALSRPIKVKSLDAIKRRTRAGMGRCQSGFCSPRTMEIISKKLNIPMTEIRKNSGKSVFAVGKTKETD